MLITVESVLFQAIALSIDKIMKNELDILETGHNLLQNGVLNLC